MFCSFPGLAKLIFATYHNLEEFLRPQGDQPATPHNPTTQFPPQTKPNNYNNEAINDPLDPKYNMIPEIEVMEVEQRREDREKMQDMEVNTNIISASVNGRKETKELPEPVIYVLEHKSVSG